MTSLRFLTISLPLCAAGVVICSSVANFDVAEDLKVATVVHFSSDHPWGKLLIAAPDALPKANEPLNEKLELQEVTAKGKISIPPGKKVIAICFKQYRSGRPIPADLSPLDRFQSDDLYALMIPSSEVPSSEVERLKRHKALRIFGVGSNGLLTDKAMKPLAELTWLSSLKIPGVEITDNGAKYLQKLTNLSVLELDSSP